MTYLNIQNVYIQHINEVEDILKSEVFDLTPLNVLKQQIQEQELLVPVIGAFSAGKSSLLNMFLANDILPTGIAPETELSTELRYSTEEYILATKVDGSTEHFGIDGFTKIKERASEFSHLKLYLDNPSLKQIYPLVLVDMPGFGSSLENHNKAINYYLPRGVYFIVLVSVEDGNITRSMMHQLNELKTLDRNFSILVSKVNLRAEHQVTEVVECISDQLDLAYDNHCPVAKLGLDAGNEFQEILSSTLNPENIFQDLFLNQLKDKIDHYISQINIAKKAVSNNSEENEQAIASLNLVIKRIEDKRHQLIQDVKEQYSDRVVNNCIDYIGKILGEHVDEFASLAVKNNPETINRMIVEIVRDSFTYKLKSEINQVSHDLVGQFNIELKSLDSISFNTNFDSDGLSNKIGQSVQTMGIVLGKVSNYMQGKSGSIFKTATTVLAVTTSVVAPAIEIAIIFLPEIISFLSKGIQEDKLKNQFRNEIIPKIKMELRGTIPATVGEQLNSMINEISDSFEQDLSEKRQLIENMEKEKKDKEELIEQEMNKLNELSHKVAQVFGKLIA